MLTLGKYLHFTWDSIVLIYMTFTYLFIASDSQNNNGYNTFYRSSITELAPKLAQFIKILELLSNLHNISRWVKDIFFFFHQHVKIRQVSLGNLNRNIKKLPQGFFSLWPIESSY